MGVSLERVQFKFASIIGELCSDPDVLSQFAVWLDLRLAEYKLKGAISLDCSGEEPDPIWLKGLSKGKKASLVLRDTSTGSYGSSHKRGPLPHRSNPQSPSKDIPESHSSMVSADVSDRLSPDVVVVKDEPSDVFPVQLHVHENMDSPYSSRRKRQAAETVSSEQWSHDMSAASPKHRRISSTVESPSNQSLMSVLSGYQDKAESDTKGDNSVLTSGPVAGVSSPSMAAGTSADLTGDFSADFTDTSINNSQSLQDFSWMNQPGMSGDGSAMNVKNPRTCMSLQSGYTPRPSSPESTVATTPPPPTPASGTTLESPGATSVPSVTMPPLSVIIPASSVGTPASSLPSVGTSEQVTALAQLAMPASSVAMPASSVAMPSSSVAMPASLVAMPASSVAIPASSVAMPASSVAMPASSVAIPASSVAMPASSVAMPASSVAMPVSSVTVAMPASSVAMPAASVAMPVSSVTVAMPASSVAMPASSVAMSASSVAMPASSVAMPASPVAMPASSVAMPAPTLAMPTSSVTMPASLDTTSAQAVPAVPIIKTEPLTDVIHVEELSPSDCYYNCDERFWQLYPYELDSMQITPQNLAELMRGREERKEGINPDCLNLSADTMSDLVKQSRSSGHLAKHLLHHGFTLRELYNKNVYGKIYNGNGPKKAPLSKWKMKELLDIVKSHYRSEESLEKTVRNSVNKALRVLWGKKLKLPWLLL